MLEYDIPPSQRPRDFQRRVHSVTPGQEPPFRQEAILQDLGGAFLFPQEHSPYQERFLLTELERITPFPELPITPAPRKATDGSVHDGSVHSRALNRSIAKRHGKDDRPKSRGGK